MRAPDTRRSISERVADRSLSCAARAACAAVVAGHLACSGTGSTDVLPPVTGIMLQAEALTTGYGCGREATQVFKYAALVLPSNPDGTEASATPLVPATVFDCFADGTFVELPVPDGGTPMFLVEVYLYNQSAYEAARDTLRGLPFTPLADVRAQLRATLPTYSTTCRAAQVANVRSLARCERPVVGATAFGGSVGATAIELDTDSLLLTDGRTARCAASAPDAGTSPPDAGAGLAFQRVEVRWVEPNATGETVRGAACGEPFRITPAVPLGRYDLRVAARTTGGGAVGEATCSATAVAGQTTAAVCARR